MTWRELLNTIWKIFSCPILYPQMKWYSLGVRNREKSVILTTNLRLYGYRGIFFFHSLILKVFKKKNHPLNWVQSSENQKSWWCKFQFQGKRTSVPAYVVRRREEILLSTTVLFFSALNKLDEAHVHWGWQPVSQSVS